MAQQQGWDLFSSKKPAQKQSQHSEDWAYLIVSGFLILLVAGWVTTSGEAWWTGTAVPWLDEWRPVLILVAALILLFAVLALVAFWKGRHHRRRQRHANERQEALPFKAQIKVSDNGQQATAVCATGVHPTDTVIKRAAESHGRALWGEPAAVDVHVNRSSGRTHLVFSAPKGEGGRDSLERDLEIVAKERLPAVTKLKVTARDRRGEPTRLHIDHAPAFRALTDDTVTEQLERALAEKLRWDEYAYRADWDPRDDTCDMYLWTDPLSTPTKALAYQEPKLIELDALPIGVKADGTPMTLNLLGGRHTLIAGRTGAGKSGLLQDVLRALAPAVHDGWVRLAGIDPKGGVELGFASDLFPDLSAGHILSRGAGRHVPKSLLDANGRVPNELQRHLWLLHWLGEQAMARAARMAQAGIRQHVPTREEPFWVIFIDEIAMLTAYLGTARDKEAANTGIGQIVTQGRALGFVLIGALQDPRKEVLKIRGLFPVKVGLRLDSKTETVMVLGDQAPTLGARCDRINPKLPGIGYVVEDGKREATRFRAAYPTDTDVKDTVKRFPAALTAIIESVDGVGPEQLSGDSPPVKVSTRKPRKAAARKRTAPGEVIGDEPATADEIEVGDWIVITEKKEQWEVQVQEVDGEDPIRLAGEGWERTYAPTYTTRRLILAE